MPFELENKEAVPTEVQCKCGKMAGYVVRLNTVEGKCDIYVCDHCGKEIRVPVKKN